MQEGGVGSGNVEGAGVVDEDDLFGGGGQVFDKAVGLKDGLLGRGEVGLPRVDV